MRKPPNSAFTLLEMLTVLTIIVILAGIVIGVAGNAMKKGARARAAGEISMISSACESYKSDNGTFPRDIPASGSSVTDNISPKSDFTPTLSKYTASSLFLYGELSGDKNADGIPDDGAQRYMKEFDPRILNATRNTSTKAIIQVNYLQDPFGFSYGYSTAAAAVEQNFQRDLKLGKSVTRPTGAQLPGFNPGSFDLWSTGGSNGSSVTSPNLEWAKWVKNW